METMWDGGFVPRRVLGRRGSRVTHTPAHLLREKPAFRLSARAHDSHGEDSVCAEPGRNTGLLTAIGNECVAVERNSDDVSCGDQERVRRVCADGPRCGTGIGTG